MHDLVMTDSEWPYLLAQNFLEAATACGWDCDRKYVGAGSAVEGPPPGCPCQLVATVTSGWAPAKAAPCMPIRVAAVTLTLDLCVPVPGSGAAPAVGEMNNAGRLNVTALQKIMHGLQTARAAGHLGGGCTSIAPDAWVAVSDAGGIARWQTRWELRE